MSPELIAQCSGASIDLAKRYQVAIDATMQEYEINTPERQAAYLAQVGHESGGFVFMHEIWGPTDSQKRYDPPGELAAALGNTEKGDGFRYRGRGPIQITGKFNYIMIGGYMGLPLMEKPELLDDATNAFRSSGAFWKWKGCNKFADLGDFVGLTRKINGGTNGLPDRERRWAVAKLELNIA